MRRLIIVALALMAGATFVKAQELKTKTDTLSYYMGMVQSQGLLNFLKQFNKDVYGEEEGIDMELFMKAFNSGVSGEGALVTPEAANEKLSTLVKEIKEATTMKKYGANKKVGEDFMKENAKKKGVVTTASGLQYRIITKGKGPIPTATQKVKVHYEGRTLDGKIFDSSYKRGEPTEFRCNQVIKGWTEALTLMPVGSVWEVYIPQELAYGERQAGDDIKPFSMLIFKIELLDIVKD